MQNSIPEGKATLMERFGLDDVQANAIVQMRLGQLTGLERQKIEDELAALGIKLQISERFWKMNHAYRNW